MTLIEKRRIEISEKKDAIKIASLAKVLASNLAKTINVLDEESLVPGAVFTMPLIMSDAIKWGMLELDGSGHPSDCSKFNIVKKAAEVAAEYSGCEFVNREFTSTNDFENHTYSMIFKVF